MFREEVRERDQSSYCCIAPLTQPLLSPHIHTCRHTQTQGASGIHTYYACTGAGALPGSLLSLAAKQLGTDVSLALYVRT